jgi:hypothetical protein
MHIDELFSAGWLPIKTVGDPGAHTLVTGVQGIGTKTPKAAAVAAATAGFAMLMQRVNGVISANGVADIMLLPGTETPIVKLKGNVSSMLGAIPKLHIFIECPTENIAITLPFIYIMGSIVFLI